MQIAPVPSEPVQLRSRLAARQLSRMGAASMGSKLDDQLQVPGVAVVSFGAASLGSAWVSILPPQVASQMSVRTNTNRMKGMLEDYARALPHRQRLACARTAGRRQRYDE